MRKFTRIQKKVLQGKLSASLLFFCFPHQFGGLFEGFPDPEKAFPHQFMIGLFCPSPVEEVAPFPPVVTWLLISVKRPESRFERSLGLQAFAASTPEDVVGVVDPVRLPGVRVPVFVGLVGFPVPPAGL